MPILTKLRFFCCLSHSVIFHRKIKKLLCGKLHLLSLPASQYHFIASKSSTPLPKVIRFVSSASGKYQKDPSLSLLQNILLIVTYLKQLLICKNLTKIYYLIFKNVMVLLSLNLMPSSPASVRFLLKLTRSLLNFFSIFSETLLTLASSN